MVFTPALGSEHYAPLHSCQLPPLKLPWDGDAGSAARAIAPGTAWTCPECGLAYIAAAGSPDRFWISFGSLLPPLQPEGERG